MASESRSRAWMTPSASASSRWAASLASMAMERGSSASGERPCGAWSDRLSSGGVMFRRWPAIAFPDAVGLAEFVEVPGDARRREGLEVPVDGPFGALEFLGDGSERSRGRAPGSVAGRGAPGPACRSGEPSVRHPSASWPSTKTPPGRRELGLRLPGAMLADVSDKDGSAD